MLILKKWCESVQFLEVLEMSSSKYMALLLPPFLLLLALQNCPLSHAANKSAVPVNVGLILDFESPVGKISNTCISLALEDFYATHNHKKRLVLHARDCKRDDSVQAASAAFDLLKNLEVEAILGPQTSQSAEFVANLGSRTRVPIISFTATSPSLSSTNTPYFVRTAQTDAAQIEALVAVIKACQWRQVVPVYEDSAFGAGLIPFLTDALQQIGVAVPNRTLVPPSPTNGDVIAGKLDELDGMETRVFVVHMTHMLGAQFFRKVYEKGMMSAGYVWIITNSVGDMFEFMNASDIAHMRGVVGVKTHIPQSKYLKEFTKKWGHRFRSDNPGTEPPSELNKYAIWAHDTVFALASAVERVAGAGGSKLFAIRDRNSTNYFQTLGTSPSGKDLLDAIQGTMFRGLGGEFQLNNGQLQSGAFKIINVVERGAKEIGFWIPGFGLSKNFNVKNEQQNKSSLDAGNVLNGSVTWPGGTREVPRGWAIPKGKTLKIGVPVPRSYKEFVDVQNNGTAVTGLCIDLFKAVVASLNYTILYVLSPFNDSSGKMAGSYDELVYQVYLQKYDAVVGDTTIIANRSKYVDFTLPYLESGVSMIVPVQPRDDNAWVFLKPMTWPLWLTTGAFFVFTGIVVWILERGNSGSEFQGPPSEQTGKVFYFIFSTLVFAQKEKLVSNQSRVVVIIWVFVVLILTSSYTASLTSMLTAQQLQPSVTDPQTLIRNKNRIGCRNGSFVVHLLNRWNVDPAKIKMFEHMETVADALTKGDKHPEGIAAFFDEIPYIKIFLQKHCRKYTMAGPVYKNAGFGFVFPKGSPLVSDISRAILNVTEGEQISKIEKDWGMSNKTECLNIETEKISSSLSLSSFWVLFLITGTASLGALIIGTISILHQYNKRELGTSPSVDSEFKSLRRKLLDFVRYFDGKDLTSLAFKNRVATVDGNQTDAATSEYQFQVQSPMSMDVPSVLYEDANFTDQDERSIHDHLQTRENANGNNSNSLLFLEVLEMSSSKYTALLLPPFLLLLALQNCPLSHAANKSAVPVNVGLILDFESQVRKISNTWISLALEDFYATHNHKKRLVLHARDCKRDDSVQAASAAIDLLKNLKVEAILGPQRSQSAEFVANLGSRTQVPIISFTATSPSLSSTNTPYFIRTAQTDAAQIEALVAVIKACQWRQVVPVYEDSAFGAGLIPFLTDALQQIGVAVPNRTLVPPSPKNGDVIARKLDELAKMETRVFVVHMTHMLGAQFFRKVHEKEMMSEGYVWIITNSIGDMFEFMNASDISHMRGVVGVKTHIPPSKSLKEFTEKWRHRFPSDNPGAEPPSELNKYAIWAHDTVFALASAVERVAGAGSSKFLPIRDRNSTNYFQTLGTSPSGKELLDAVQETTRIKGLFSEFKLNNGQLQSGAFKIINVVERGAKEIGFWIPGFGLSKNFKVKNKQQKRSSLEAGNVLNGAVTWPGGSREVPRGWAIPKGKTLKIGVPVQLAYKEFVDKYDAVVGDITTIANRSKYVDFTLPYLESGVSMIVPVQPRDDNAWVFLKPMTRPLWLTTGAFFVLTGIVVWILERGCSGSEFQGPPSEQTGKVFYFIFSTLVFAQKEKLVSNLSRVVVIVWVFVVLILTSSYTASLTSMLTAQQLQPSVTDPQTLIRNKNRIGFRNGTFVVHLLNRLNVDPEKIKEFEDMEAVADALTKEGEQLAKIKKKWGMSEKTECVNEETEKISSSLSLSSFWGLFLITGTASLGALIIGTISILHQYNKRELGTSPSVDTEFKSIWRKLLDFVRYFDEKDLTSLAFKNRVTTVDGNQTDAATSEYQFQGQSPMSMDAPSVLYEDANFTDQDERSIHDHLQTREDANGNNSNSLSVLQ
ncbi:Glutamate receptor 2-7 [Nymphaea thermarum]|nr:Glutamate receptor 2-7 [Nymphaea thermarum]